MSIQHDPTEQTPAAPPRDWRRLALLTVFLVALVGLYAAGAYRYLDWQFLRDRIHDWREQTQHHRLLAAVVVFAAYVSLTSLSLPASGVMSMLCGALFDHCLGTCVASLSCTTGAALSFLGSRYLLHDLVRRRFGPRLAAIDRGVRRDGAFYLFSLRLSPAPFFLVNVAMALTPMRAGTFILVTWLGTLVPCLLFVNAGAEWVRIRTLADVLSPGVIGSLVLLGLAPLALRLLATRIRGMREADCGGGAEGEGKLR
jgi:uncharacterized membrane protein YdjX (TVP38/TMEM64 family)